MMITQYLGDGADYMLKDGITSLNAVQDVYLRREVTGA